MFLSVVGLLSVVSSGGTKLVKPKICLNFSQMRVPIIYI